MKKKERKILPEEGFPVYYETITILDIETIEEIDQEYEKHSFKSVKIDTLNTTKFNSYNSFFKPISTILSDV